MSPWETPAALRDALEARLAVQADESGLDLGRLRRRAVFERLLYRLEAAQPGRFVLKGGVALEVRLGDRARATKDIDLAFRAGSIDGQSLRELLIEALAIDAAGDGFRFEVGEPQPLSETEAGRLGWRFHVDGYLAKLYVQFRVEIVARDGEAAPTERLQLPCAVAFADFPPAELDVLARTQHFAEKLHAYTRSYGERENSRERDLADLVLFVEEGFDDLDELRRVVDDIFAARATHDVPTELPDAPASWEARFAQRADELDLTVGTLGDAVALVRELWSTVPARQEA